MATLKFKGFYVILTEERVKNGNVFHNPKFSHVTKRLIKKGKAYTTDVERERYDMTCIVRRKICFPMLSIDELEELFDNCQLRYDAQTMGSLTAEHGWLSAVSYSYYAEYPSYGGSYQNTNAYVSVLFEDEGVPVDIDKYPDMVEFFQLKTSEFDESIHELIKDSAWSDLVDMVDNDEFTAHYDINK